MDKKEIIIIGKASDSDIQAWKARHRKVYEVIIEDDGEHFAGYFKRPNMDVFSAVNKLSKTDEVKAAGILFDSCLLGGANEIKEDSILKMSAISQLKNMMAVKSAELKNL